jgi:hypothetical protein
VASGVPFAVFSAARAARVAFESGSESRTLAPGLSGL